MIQEVEFALCRDFHSHMVKLILFKESIAEYPQMLISFRLYSFVNKTFRVFQELLKID